MMNDNEERRGGRFMKRNLIEQDGSRHLIDGINRKTSEAPIPHECEKQKRHYIMN